MKDLFVPYNIAVRLKNIGFNELCFGKYTSDKYLVSIGWSNVWCENILTDEVYAPTFSQSFKFFREKHGLFIQPNRTIDSEGTWYYFYIASKRTDVCEGSFVYEEAELRCLDKLIQIVEHKNKIK